VRFQRRSLDPVLDWARQAPPPIWPRPMPAASPWPWRTTAAKKAGKSRPWSPNSPLCCAAPPPCCCSPVPA
jgi:hypothetical protein